METKLKSKTRGKCKTSKPLDQPIAEPLPETKHQFRKISFTVLGSKFFSSSN